MNRDEAKAALPAFIAFCEGKDIQSRPIGGSRFVHNNDPAFMSGIIYQVKPEPRVVYVNEYEEFDDAVYKTKEKAVDGAADYAIRVAVKYIEVEDTQKIEAQRFPETDMKHKNKINKALQNLVDSVPGLDRPLAKLVIEAIAERLISNVTIRY